MTGEVAKPSVKDIDESDAELVDGELVDDEPPASDRAPAWLPRQDRATRRHPRARVAALFAIRHAILVAQGHQSWAQRMLAAATHGHAREQIEQAKAAGDHERLAAWIDRLQQLREKRQARIKALPHTVLAAARMTCAAVLAFAALLLVIGIVAKVGMGRAGWTGWWHGVATAGHVVSVLVSVGALAVVYGAIPGWLALAWREGRRRGRPITWAMAPKQVEAQGSIITPSGIAEALNHLPIAELKREIKKGWTVKFVVPPVKVGDRGYETIFELPLGVTVDMIADARPVLARNLARSTMEVWPTQEEDHNGICHLWVANPGATKRPAPPYPLLTSGVVDVFAGVPCGVSQRGDVIAPPLFEANFVFGGLPGQGKSNAVRVVMLGAALDPIAELWVFVFAGNGDFDVYQPRLARYHRGTGPEVIDAAISSLDELYNEIGRREQRIAELGVKKVSRAVAEKHPDLRPIVAAFSEVHGLFGAGKAGKAAAETAVDVVKRGRKVGIILLFDTQSARKDAIPLALVENVSSNTCFYVKTWRNNDGFLGDGSFQAGIRATELRYNVDRGTSVSTGFSDEAFEILRWYYIAADDTGYDQAAEVIARAMKRVHRSVPVGGRGGVLAPERRDLFEDLDEVLDGDRVNAPDVAAWLRELAPDWGPYRALTGVDLKRQLEAAGIKVPTTGNKLWIDPLSVRRVLAARSTADLDE